MGKKNFYGKIENIEEYRDFIDEVVKLCPYSVYMNGKKADKRKIVSEAAIDDAEDWFDNDIPVSYLIKNDIVLMYIGND